MRWLLTLLPAAVWGGVTAWWTPRGPLTTTQALVSIVVGIAVGVAAGRAVRSRRVILLAPLAYALALELARLRVTGPSVDAPHLSPFGVIALVTGRGVHALLALVPIALGAALFTRIRYVAAALLVVLTVAAGLPARTAPIPGGVAELTRFDGLTVMIRGARADLPVLLFVPGAPGGSELGAMRRQLSALERHFVVATLDRRGGGGSYPALDPTSAVTLDGQVADVLAVTDRLRSRFRQEKIFLLGFSGGSVLAALAAHREPAKYRAYIGTGQAVDLRASDEICYADMLAWARTTGRADLAAQLERQGPPPYADVWSYEPFLLHANEMYAQGEPAFEIGVREYTPLQKAHTLVAILDTWSVLYPRMQHVDLRRDVPRLAIPAVFVQGGNEMRGLSALFDPWYARLRAPSKRLVVFPGAGHRAMFEQPGRFVEVLAGLTPG